MPANWREFNLASISVFSPNLRKRRKLTLQETPPPVDILTLCIVVYFFFQVRLP